MAEVTILLFAAARERAGERRVVVSLQPGARVSDVLAALVARFPTLGPLVPHLRVAVNQEFAGLDALVPSGAEVALIPPVAGGSPRGLFAVVDRPLVLDDVIRAVEGDARGGLVTFSGVVRDMTRGRKVMRLEYEAYGEMAQRQLVRIGEEIEAHWPGTRVAIIHRVGVLLPGELAVVIACAAPHRAEAFEGCRHAIERLKQDVPIWKKELYADGETWVGLGP